ncbi:MAG: class I SAM-dependent methyltransferase [Acidobacteria bacterium]|nr:class I SAM-dependent methyltransferase [Acidobacteriota bacterium]
MERHLSRPHLFLSVALLIAGTAALPAQTPTPPAPFEPTVGQAGKDVVWVPTPEALVEKMLDMAEVGPSDLVMDLGSGDGRNIIGAAKRGARAVGVEFNPDMVALARHRASEAGVGDKATFIEGDMYAADISKATVMALFLLPVNMDKLAPKFLELAPGSRIVANTFAITGWNPDRTESITASGCTSWCTALLWTVPAKVAGTWQTPQGDLMLTQDFQVVAGTLGSMPIVDGKLTGRMLQFSTGASEHSAEVSGDTMTGTVTTNGRQERWTATRRQ